MVFVHTLLEGNTASMNSSAGSVPTEVLHIEDEDYDLDLPPHPLGLSCLPVFPLIEEIWSSMSAGTYQSLMEKPMIRDSSARNATLIAPNDTQKSSNDS